VFVHKSGGLRMVKVRTPSGLRRWIVLPTQSRGDSKAPRDLPGVLQPEREFGHLGRRVQGLRRPQPEILLIRERGHVVRNRAQHSRSIAARWNDATVVGAGTDGMRTEGDGSGFYDLELPLAPIALTAIYHLTDASDRKADQRIAWRGIGKQVRGERREI